MRDRLNRLVGGWAAYFSYGTRLMAYRAVDNHVYDRVRHFLVRRHKVPSRGTRALPRWGGVRRARRAAAPPGSSWRPAVCLEVKPVGKPDAGNPHVRFDERGRETERCRRGPSHRARPRLYPRRWRGRPVLIGRAASRGAGGAIDRGWAVAGDGLGRGTPPRGSGRPRGPGGEQREAVPVGIAGRQRELDPGRQLGDPAGHLDQRETDRVELGVAPERASSAPGRAGCAGASRRRCAAPAGTGWRSPWCTRSGPRRGAACAP